MPVRDEDKKPHQSNSSPPLSSSSQSVSMHKPERPSWMDQDTFEIQSNPQTSPATLSDLADMIANLSDIDPPPGQKILCLRPSLVDKTDVSGIKLDSCAVQKKRPSWMDEDTSEIQPNPRDSPIFLDLAAMIENLPEIDPPPGQKILRMRSSLMGNKDVSQIQLDSCVVHRCGNTPDQDARLEALVGPHGDLAVGSSLRIGHLFPTTGVVAKVDERSYWVVRKFASIMETCGHAIAWIKVHVFRKA